MARQDPDVVVPSPTPEMFPGAVSTPQGGGSKKKSKQKPEEYVLPFGRRVIRVYVWEKSTTHNSLEDCYAGVNNTGTNK